jgi:hypothetical protein
MVKKYSKKQKVYRMKGCSKKSKTKTKKYLGGDTNLAYPSNNVPTVPNPFLSYTGKGGAVMPTNVNSNDKTIPNTGPPSAGYNFINPQGAQRGGGCGCGLPLMSGGNSAGLISSGFMVGGKNHRNGCKCSKCKLIRGQKGGNEGIPYPNGLVGNPWQASADGLPGVDGIPGDRNYLAQNNYHSDIQLDIKTSESNPPLLIGGKRSKTRKQRGGTMSNFLAQDLVNLGRQFQYGLGSAYNAVAGYSAPVNPMPWKEQLVNTPNFATLRI